MEKSGLSVFCKWSSKLVRGVGQGVRGGSLGGSFSKISKGKYSQIFTIGFVKKKYPLDFNKDYKHVNGLDESCRSSITITGGIQK